MDILSMDFPSRLHTSCPPVFVSPWQPAAALILQITKHFTPILLEHAPQAPRHKHRATLSVLRRTGIHHAGIAQAWRTFRMLICISELHSFAEIKLPPFASWLLWCEDAITSPLPAIFQSLLLETSTLILLLKEMKWPISKSAPPWLVVELMNGQIKTAAGWVEAPSLPVISTMHGGKMADVGGSAC